MTLLLTASAVFVLITLLFLFSLGRHLRRRRPLKATRSLVGGAASGAAGGASVMLAFSYYGYDRLIEEQAVASVQFEQELDRRFVARVMVDGKTDRFFDLVGDEWQLDARIVTWKPPATLLGLDPIYQLDRISGRYTDVGDETAAPKTAHALSDTSPLDVWRFARQYPGLMPGVDAHYGTATFLPMADGARYEVSLTRTALIARPANEAAREAVGRWGE